MDLLRVYIRTTTGTYMPDGFWSWLIRKSQTKEA